MKRFRYVVLLVFIGIFLGCGTSKKVVEPNMKLDQMMVEKAFEIKVKSAEPMITQALGQVANSGILPPGNTIARIDVTGSGYFIKVQGDSVSADLPYFGERQMGGGYNSDSGIKFNGLAKDMEVTKDETKQRYTLNFTIDSSSENYFVLIEIGTNLSSTTSIRSSHRNRIRFIGDVNELVAEDYAAN
ncbi:DUF4251 domain-containing protein [Maribacter algarum]|nr:DUF4251 domain-containing protein [Maribacter algarum]